MAEHLLLIEDDPELGSQIVDYLTKAGFELSWRTEGELPMPEDFSGVSLLILDLMLPGVWGMDILKRLRTFSDVPVLILSARNNSFDKVRALKAGADDYMTKPFWPEELTERVKGALAAAAAAKGRPDRTRRLAAGHTPARSPLARGDAGADARRVRSFGRRCCGARARR